MKIKIQSILIVFLSVFLIPFIAFSLAINGSNIYSESGKLVKLIGIEIPYFLILDENQQKQVLDELKELNIKTIKILVSFNGEKEYAFQPSLGKYNEKMFEKLDKILAIVQKYDINLIMALADNNSDFGGKEIYKEWLSGSNDNIFFKDRIAIEYHKKFINKIITRKNSITGRYYYSDPSIIGWDICNKIENVNDVDGSVIYNWVNEISDFIKERDKNHFIIVSKKRPEISDEKINDFDIGLNSKIDFIIYCTDNPDNIINYNNLYYENINKPVALSINLNSENLKSTVETFFNNKGSLMLINNFGFYNYKKEGDISFDDKIIKENIKEAIKITEKSKEAKRLNIKNLQVITYAKDAKINLSFDETVEGGYVFYGTSLPLKNKTEFKNGKNIITDINNLQPETKYLYMIKAKSKDTAMVSGIKSFTTQKIKRLTAVPFKMSNNFIKAKDGAFYDGNKKYKYLGANNYYIRHKDKKLIDEIFRQAANVGIKVIRIGSNGEAESMDAIDKREKNRFFRIGPDYFNEDAYREFDYVLDSAARHNIRVIIHFTDNWEYYGGVKVYTKWAGLSNKNLFWTDETCKKFYKQTIDSFIKRKNTVNGKLYKNDPTIFAFDLMNEPRNEDDITSVTLANWIDEMSTYIKSIDSNHMVTTGMEGFFLRSDGTHYSGSDFILCHKPENIDFCTYHIYPASEYNNFSMSTTEWLIKRFIKSAHETLNKPVVMEEYGIPNNNPDFPKAKWIEFMTETFFNNGGDGANYWFFIDPDYHYGDGNEINWTQTEYMNIFIKISNVLNK